MALLCWIPAFPAAVNAFAQDAQPTPSVVQPGAPGMPSKTLPPGTTGHAPALSQADVAFMQGMIMHHSQAVEMTGLIPSHTTNPELSELGARIRRSQSDEMSFMKQWLLARGLPIAMPMPMSNTNAMPGMAMGASPAPMLMPGMLTAEQMTALRGANGAQFDHLFLTGMIQHHNGALVMVRDLFDNPGAGQDADVFNFATDADNTQRAEIKIMQNMLAENSPAQEQK